MRTEVMVLSTLHHFHGQVACYGYDALERIVTAFAPDLLFVEVSQEDLLARADERIKQEYPKVVYPLLDRHGWKALPLEPSGEVFKTLVRRKRTAERTLTQPQLAAMTASMTDWIDGLFAGWSSPADANSARTDAAVLAKNARIYPEYPPDYTRVWDEWNEFFLACILRGIEQFAPRRALVLIGLEHSYWLRPRLAAQDHVTLLDAERFLRRMPCG